MLSNSLASTAIWLLSMSTCWKSCATETDNALTDSENQYLFKRLLYNLRSSQNRQKSVNDLMRDLFPIDKPATGTTGNNNVLLQVLAGLESAPFHFGGPNDDPSSSVLSSANNWRGDAGSKQQPTFGAKISPNQLVEDDVNKRWGSGPGPRGKRLAIDLRDRRRDGPGPRGKRQGPRGKKQGPRGKKEEEDYCLETIANTKYLCHCSDPLDPQKCQVVGDD